MALRHAIKLPSITPVAAGSVASVTVPKGPAFRAFHIYAEVLAVAATEAQMKAAFDDIRIKVNGVTRLEGSGTDWLDPLGAYYAIATTNGVLTIELSPSWAKTIQGQDNLRWGTADVDTLTIEIDQNGASAVDLLEVYAEIDPVKEPLGVIREVHKITESPGATGTLEISGIPRSQGALQAVHMDVTGAAAATAFEVFADQVRLFDANEIVSRHMLGRRGERVPQTDYLHFEPSLLGRVADNIPLASLQDFRIKLTVGTAGSIPVIFETLNTPLARAA